MKHYIGSLSLVFPFVFFLVDLGSGIWDLRIDPFTDCRIRTKKTGHTYGHIRSYVIVSIRPYWGQSLFKLHTLIWVLCIGPSNPTIDMECTPFKIVVDVCKSAQNYLVPSSKFFAPVWSSITPLDLFTLQQLSGIIAFWRQLPSLFQLVFYEVKVCLVEVMGSLKGWVNARSPHSHCTWHVKPIVPAA